MPPEAAMKSKNVENVIDNLCIPNLHKTWQAGNETTRGRVKNYLVVEQKLSLGRIVV